MELPRKPACILKSIAISNKYGPIIKFYTKYKYSLLGTIVMSKIMSESDINVGEFQCKVQNRWM